MQIDLDMLAENEEQLEDVYDIIAVWQLYKNEAHNCSQIELIPKYHPDGEKKGKSKY